jgi:hypothetical protein
VTPEPVPTLAQVPSPAPVTNPHNIPFIDGTGLISLGAAVPSSIKRLAKHADEIVKKGIPLPDSPFVEWAADRCTGDDRQDLVIFIQGRRGSGIKGKFALLLTVNPTLPFGWGCDSLRG